MSKGQIYRAGVIMAGLLGLADIVAIFTTATPPVFVVILSVLIGLISIVGAIVLWRRYSTPWFWAVVITRFLSALSSLPVLFLTTDDAGDPITTGLRVTVVIFLVLNLVNLVLLLGARTHSRKISAVA